MPVISPVSENSGFTLVELVIAIVIAGILATVALRSGKTISDISRVEETKAELDALATAIAGNATLANNSVRTDFGYVGDVGALPANLDALYTNPGGYATWRGPYIPNRFSQVADDYKKDSWGVDYTFGSTTITSTGGGTSIVRKVAEASSDLTINRVTGILYDLDGTPPGSTYKDSITLRLTIPNGTGSTITKTKTPNAGGFFTFDSIPIGNHDLQVIYKPLNDTTSRFVTVTPKSTVYNEHAFSTNLWVSP
ncbi:MAG: type II secretion system protein [candidate division Zixibacteria bacterium]|mgnify:CR=1 FL=1|nr:type II secretion system protein [candidate division Zixibacteria bacterium]